MTPSRQFMIQQAVLNAAVLDPLYPRLSVSQVLAARSTEDWVAVSVQHNTRAAFHAIASRYQRRVAA